MRSSVKHHRMEEGDVWKQAIDVSLGLEEQVKGLRWRGGGNFTKPSKLVRIPTWTASAPYHSKP